MVYLVATVVIAMVLGVLVLWHLAQRQMRSLTDKERALLGEIFGDSLNMDGCLVASAPWVVPGYAIAPFGRVYFHPRDIASCFASLDLGRQMWFVHEMTHVWQHQNAQAVFWRALINRTYRYELTANKQLLDYGIEQQACIVADLFACQMHNAPCEALKACCPMLYPSSRSSIATKSRGKCPV